LRFAGRDDTVAADMAASRVLSLLAMYRREVHPIVTGAGYEGTVARAVKKFARGQYSVHASGKGAKLRVRVAGSDPTGTYLPFVERFDVAPAARAATIAKIAKKMRAVLATIDKRNGGFAPARKVGNLPDAMKALVERLSQVLGAVTITGVEERGRELVLRVKGRRTAVAVDRTTLWTLLHELWGKKALPRGAEPLYVLEQDETWAYIEQLARIDRTEARAVYLHLYSPHQTFGAARTPLHKLFPKPHWAAKKLNEGATASHVAKRALEFVRKGPLDDRVAALSVLRSAASASSTGERYAKENARDIAELISELVTEPAPILHEIATLLEYELARHKV
jgi:hypothetical protein